MLSDVLFELESILKAAIPEFRLIKVMAEYEQNLLLRSDQIPACIIMHKNTTHLNGNWADIETRNYHIVLRLIHSSVKHNRVRKGDNNLLDLYERVFDTLSRNKKLNGIADGFDRDGGITEQPTFAAGRASAMSLDIPIKYFKLFAWAGVENNESVANLAIN